MQDERDRNGIRDGTGDRGQFFSAPRSSRNRERASHSAPDRGRFAANGRDVLRRDAHGACRVRERGKRGALQAHQKQPADARAAAQNQDRLCAHEHSRARSKLERQSGLAEVSFEHIQVEAGDSHAWQGAEHSHHAQFSIQHAQFLSYMMDSRILPMLQIS